MTVFRPISFVKKGTIQEVLKASYSDFFTFFPNEKNTLFDQWDQEDEKAFNNKNIGNHTMFTCINDLVIGYFSWDDRNSPIGLIGQNCILPAYRNQGYGKKQLEFIEENFKRLDFKEISVVTGDHKFFIPAQKMYLTCDYKIKRVSNGTLFQKIEFSKLI
jgi:GNAT superfamily N-acetyltransferase